MSLVTSIKRKVIVPVLYGSGIPFRGMKNGNKNVIFNYHGVIPAPFPRINNRHLSTSQFEEDLRFFRKRFNVVSLAEIFEHPELSGSNNRPKVAITFDDGFENNLKYALPLLKKYDFPATIFVLSATIHQPDFVNWADLLDVHFAATNESELEFMDEPFVRRPSGYYHKVHQTLSLSDFIKNQGIERLEPLNKFAASVLKNRAVREKYRDHIQLMDSQQLQACTQSGKIEIASHSRYHFNIGRITVELAEDELVASRDSLQELLQKEVVSIAYPDGDYTTTVKNLAEKAGYTRQLAVNFRLPEDAKDQRIRHRFSYSNSTTHQSNLVRLGMQWNKYSF